MTKPLREHDHTQQRPPLEWQRRGQVREAIDSYWSRHNSVPLVWSQGEEKATIDLVRSTRLCGYDFQKLVQNRENTPGINHATRPAKWIRSLANFARSPSPATRVSA